MTPEETKELIRSDSGVTELKGKVAEMNITLIAVILVMLLHKVIRQICPSFVVGIYLRR